MAIFLSFLTGFCLAFTALTLFNSVSFVLLPSLVAMILLLISFKRQPGPYYSALLGLTLGVELLGIGLAGRFALVVTVALWLSQQIQRRFFFLDPFGRYALGVALLFSIYAYLCFQGSSGWSITLPLIAGLLLVILSALGYYTVQHDKA
ncbi:MAG: hypothetical protein WCG94_04755 [Methanothrix sp.]